MRHFFGRVFQLTGLLALPSALWTAEVLHSEALTIGILVASVLLFFLGWILVR